MSDLTAEPVVQHHPGRLLSILSLVGGIISVIISAAGWGIILPIVAIVLGLLGRARERSGKRIWLTGVLLSIAALVVSGISLYYQYLTVMAVAGFTGG